MREYCNPAIQQTKKKKNELILHDDNDEVIYYRDLPFRYFFMKSKFCNFGL